MNITVYTVSEEFAVSEAYTMFRTLGLRHLVVVSERNKLKGMITKKDLLEHSCIEKYKELKRYTIKIIIIIFIINKINNYIEIVLTLLLKRLKKMNIDLPADELEMDSTPGTPAEPGAIRMTEHFRKRFSPAATPLRSSPLSTSQVIYAVDPPQVEKDTPSSPPSPS